MNMAWKTDPRLRGMDPKKLELLSLFSEDIKKTPPDKMLSALMTLNKRASASGLFPTGRRLLSSLFSRRGCRRRSRKSSRC